MAIQSILILLTVASVVTAIATTMALRRRLHEERARSEARVELLRDLSTDQDELVLRPGGSSSTGESEIFRVDSEPTPWLGRLVAAAAVALVVVAGAWTWSSVRTRPANTPAQAAAVDAPLELLSLRHSVEDQNFVVTGLVQNPKTGSQLMRVEATVLLFDSRGTMLTSGRAPLDFTALAAGDESPFLIRVPVSGTVARYRVGFRRADGHVLGHLDRRNHESIAQRREP